MVRKPPSLYHQSQPEDHGVYYGETDAIVKMRKDDPMVTQFCLQCGTPLVTGTIEGHEREFCSACSFILYRCPAPVAMAVIKYDGKFLFVQRSIPPLKNYWAPPAGHVEIGESVTQAAVREAKEETGVDAELEDLIGVYSHPAVQVILIAYSACAIGGIPSGRRRKWGGALGELSRSVAT